MADGASFTIPWTRIAGGLLGLRGQAAAGEVLLLDRPLPSPTCKPEVKFWPTKKAAVGQDRINHWHPNGVAIDRTEPGEQGLTIPLTYPAPRPGVWQIRCTTCGKSTICTARGLSDDPRSYRMGCGRTGSAEPQRALVPHAGTSSAY